MFFLKKFISSFLLPLPITLFLFALGVFFLFKNSYVKAKIVLFFTLSWLALLSFQPISNAILEPLEKEYKPLIQTPDVKYIAVLGNEHVSNEFLPITSQLNMTAQNRLNEGLRHLSKLKNATLILSGAKGYDKNSHAFMQELLVKSLGVKNKILRLDFTKDTQEEIIELKKRLKNEKVILVTSASHMKRTMLLCKKYNLNAIASPTNFLALEKKDFSSFFSSENIKKIELAMHEYLGLLFYKIKDYI